MNGNPRIVNHQYLRTVDSIEAAFDAASWSEEIDSVEFGLTRDVQFAQCLGLAPACSTDHHVPLASRPTGNTPDMLAFEAAVPELVDRLEQLGAVSTSVTVRVGYRALAPRAVAHSANASTFSGLI